MSGQSVIDRLNAAKHSLAGQGLAKAVCKASTEEVMGPKRKHLDYLLQCTNEPNVSTPQMADLLIDRTQSSNWIVVFKALITIHNLMNYGNEKFFQYLASNNCSLTLENFLDKSHVQGFDMSTYIRKYAKYINEKVVSYRALAYDLCKVKKGKEDGLLRTMPADKMLKALSALQNQIDALLEFDATPNDLVNGVISAAFLLLCKDLVRLFACYNDGIINLLEKYFGLNRRQCREALDIYKQFLLRMDKISAFLKGAEPWAKKQNAGIDSSEIPDLAKAPASLLETLEAHLSTLEAKKKKSKPKGVMDPAAPTNESSAGVTAGDGVLLKKEDNPSATEAKEGSSQKGDRPSKPRMKKKSSKPSKEGKDSMQPPLPKLQPSPKHSPPPRPPPAVCKTPQTMSPLHSNDKQAAALTDSSQPLLILEPVTKPSDDLLELSICDVQPINQHGDAVNSLLHETADATKALSPDGICESDTTPRTIAVNNNVPARISSNVDLLSDFEEPVECPVEKHESNTGLLGVECLIQEQDVNAKLPQQLTPTKKTPAVQSTGVWLLDFDPSRAEPSLDVTASTHSDATKAVSSVSQDASTSAVDLLGSPLDTSNVPIVQQSSTVAAATLLQPAALTSKADAGAISSSGDLLDLLLTPAASAADKSQNSYLLASDATTSVTNAEADLLSLEPELDELDSANLLLSLDPLKAKNGTIHKILGNEATSAVIRAPSPTPLSAKESKSPLAPCYAPMDSGRPAPPPYSAKDPIEMAMMKNMSLVSTTPAKSAAGKPTLAGMSKQMDISKSPGHSLGTTTGNANAGLVAAPLKHQQPPAFYDVSKGTVGDQSQSQSRKPIQDKVLIGPDLDTSLISLASNITANSGTQRQKGSFQWNTSTEKKITGGADHQNTKQQCSSSHPQNQQIAAQPPMFKGDSSAQSQVKLLLASQPAKLAAASSGAQPTLPMGANKEQQPTLDPFGSL